MKKSILLLCALAGAFSITPASAEDCATLWASGFPDPAVARGPLPCSQFVPDRSVLPARVSMFVVDPLLGDPSLKERMEWAAEALSYAHAKFSSLGGLKEVTLVRHDRPYFRETSDTITYGFTPVRFYSATEACPIVLYPASDHLSKDHFLQLVAHELFHCFQNDNFPRQTQAAAGDDVAHWWLEGLAQFFSNWVYPSNDFEYHPVFGRLDPALPFFEQSKGYLAEHFFQELFNFLGGDAAQLVSIMGSMPTTDMADAATYAMRLPRVSEALHEYAQNLAEGRLQDSSGHSALLRATKEEIAVPSSASSSHNLSVMSFAVGAYRLILPKGGRYRFTLNRPAGLKVSAKKAEDIAYGEFPTEMTTTCDADRKLDVVATHAGAPVALNALRVDVVREANEECGCGTLPPPSDSCLYGKWELDHSSVRQFMERLLPRPQGQFRDSTGRFQVEFLENGELIWTFQN
jgi:hypothetical protein